MTDPKLNAVSRVLFLDGILNDMCSAVLISPRLALTAAHCVNEYFDVPRSWQTVRGILFLPGIGPIKAGVFNHLLNSGQLQLVKTFPAPGFKKFWVDGTADSNGLDRGDHIRQMYPPEQINDLALIVLKTPQKVVPLRMSNETPDQLVSHQQQGFFAGFPATVAKTYIQELPPTMKTANHCAITAKNPNGLLDVDCPIAGGMSGGPFIIRKNGKYEIAGILSSGAPRDSQIIPLAAHSDWIRRKIAFYENGIIRTR